MRIFLLLFVMLLLSNNFNLIAGHVENGSEIIDDKYTIQFVITPETLHVNEPALITFSIQNPNGEDSPQIQSKVQILFENNFHQNLLVGETYQQNSGDGRWVVQTPDGNLHLAITTGNKTTSRKTLNPGVYSVFKLPENYLQNTITKLPLGSQPTGTFTINVDTKESSPQKISEEDIK